MNRSILLLICIVLIAVSAGCGTARPREERAGMSSETQTASQTDDVSIPESPPATARQYAADGILFESAADHTCIIRGADQTDGTLTVPVTSPKGETVAAIGKDAFAFSQLESVVIRNAKIRLEENAFMLCRNLESVLFEDCTITVEQNVFYGAGRDLSVQMKNCSVFLQGSAFENASVKSVAASGSSFSAEQNAFGSCAALRSIDLACSFVSLDGYAFYNCEQLSSVFVGTASPGMVRIQKGAFRYCEKLSDIRVCGQKKTASELENGMRLTSGQDAAPKATSAGQRSRTRSRQYTYTVPATTAPAAGTTAPVTTQPASAIPTLTSPRRITPTSGKQQEPASVNEAESSATATTPAPVSEPAKNTAAASDQGGSGANNQQQTSARRITAPSAQ